MRGYDAARVSELAAKIIEHKRLYYTGKPLLSDAAYDKLEDELRAQAPDHPVLAMVGSDLVASFRKVTHDRPMLSLQKTYDLSELNTWREDRPVVGMWKIDGNSLSLIYRKGKLALAKTRGNGLVGEDVTDKARWVADILPVLPTGVTGGGDVEIRGELVCLQSRFEDLAKSMSGRQLEAPTNPRNIVAGLLGRKTHFDLACFFNFFAFDVEILGGDQRFKFESERIAWLKDAGFKGPDPETLRTAEDVESYIKKTRRVMEDGEVGVDGVVFVYDDVMLQHELGETSHHPRYKISFKWQGETAIAEIENITWATSRLGIVTPVAVIEPVYLSGAKITNVTLHNAAMVKTHNLKKGDRIEIVRSGEVIPKFLAVVEPFGGSFKWPTKCPSCDEHLEFDEVRLKCPNEDGCPAQRSGSILNWIENVEIEDLSEKRLEQMMDLGLVREIPDLYALTMESLLKLPQTKEKMASKLLANIEGSRKVPLAKFLCGLGIEGSGRTTWEKLLEVFGDLDGMLGASMEDIQQVEGFAERSAEQICSGLQNRKPLINALLAAGVTPVVSRRSSGGPQPLAGKQIVITGSLSRPRAEIEEAIRQAGGSPGSSVSKNTFAVVTEEADSTSSKMKKARDLGIPVWNEAQLWAQLGAK